MKQVFIANWKMNLSVKESLKQIRKLNDMLGEETEDAAEIIVCPSFVALWPVSNLLKELGTKKIKLGAQDVFWEEEGAFTGEISPGMLKEVGCQYIIVGHSERRENLRESDQMVNKKIKAALKNGLTPIFCVGETAEERKNNLQDMAIERQINLGLESVGGLGRKRLIVAYEPVWAIGTGEEVEPKEAARVSQLIRGILAKTFTPETVEKNVIMLYGGSVDGGNIGSFLKEKEIGGVLVGGASVRIEKFIKIIKSIF